MCSFPPLSFDVRLLAQYVSLRWIVEYVQLSPRDVEAMPVVDILHHVPQLVVAVV